MVDSYHIITSFILVQSSKNTSIGIYRSIEAAILDRVYNFWSSRSYSIRSCCTEMNFTVFVSDSLDRR